MLKTIIYMLGFGLWFGCVLVKAAENDAGKTKATACASCHGVDGNSRNSQWPSLAGQKTEYLSSQIRAFRDGKRENASMKSMVADLTDIDAENLAEYFSGQKSRSAGGNAELAKKGKAKYVLCAECHGEKAEGLGIGPRLAGQHPGYTSTQLENFKSGVRENPIMQPIASNLNPDDIKALAAYIGSLE